jgi:excisionase family DNA binding protein
MPTWLADTLRLLERAAAGEQLQPIIEEPERLVTTAEAAVLLDITDRTVRNWIAAKRLRGIRHGKDLLAPLADVEAEVRRAAKVTAAPARLPG